MKVLILWCGKQFDLKRLVVNSKLPASVLIEGEAQRLSIPIVMDDDQTVPAPGDLWVGLCPQKGWGNHVGDCGEARTAEAGTVLSRLRNAQMSK